MSDEEELSDDIELDPRWEVQPVPVTDDEAGGGRRWIVVVVMAAVLFAATVVWLSMGTSPAG